MQGLKVLLLTVLSATCFGYRLPGTQKPSKYVVDLEVKKDVFQGTSTAFNGTVAITFQIRETTNNIILHARVNVQSVSLEFNGTSLTVTDYSDYNSTTALLNITVSEWLEVSKDYVLTIAYTGVLDTTDMRGFYRSNYVDSNNTMQYLVTTQFQSTHARSAFPCFDEPEYKATFLISITYPKGFSALCNTPQTSKVAVDNDYEKVTFLQTPIMSSYLVAFIISKFTCTKGVNIDANIPYQVCSRNESASDREWAVTLGTPIMKVLEKITNITYSSQLIGKMDQVAIPDFSAGAMENWGLVTYRETALLYNPQESSNAQKSRVATVVAHEFTHMWFGNLVTMKWWDYTFLNEGFARFYQYFAAAQVAELAGWEMHRQFVIDQLQTIFVADASSSSAALSSPSETPTEISDKFASTSYNKGASIFRMVEHLMGAENFQRGIRNYLSTYASSTTIPLYLWNQLTIFLSEGILPRGVTLAEVMENWTEKPGFPVIYVNVSGNNLILSQGRFLYSGRDSENTEWYVPISYTLSSDADKFQNTSVRAWLTPGGTLTISGVLEQNDWIILNNQETGYYRVNYNTILWDRIIQVLVNNYTAIDVINRAQIVDDALNLARASKLKYSKAFEILRYLQNETDYYPWYAAISGFNYLHRMIGKDSVLGVQISSMVLELLQNVYNSVSFTSLDDNNQIYSLKLVLVLTRACKLGEHSCVSQAKELFNVYKAGTRVDKNLRSVVYCTALANSESIETDWNFLWEKLKTTSLAHEQITIISALGCTTNTTILKYYLEQSINGSSVIRQQDLASVWSAVYTGSPEGVDAAMDYLYDNYGKVADYYSKASSLLINVASRFTKEEQIRKLELFNETQTEETSLKSTIKSALRVAKQNLNWVSNIQADLNDYFDLPSTLSTTTQSTETTTAGTGNIQVSFLTVSIIIISIMLLI